MYLPVIYKWPYLQRMVLQLLLNGSAHRSWAFSPLSVGLICRHRQRCRKQTRIGMVSFLFHLPSLISVPFLPSLPSLSSLFPVTSLPYFPLPLLPFPSLHPSSFSRSRSHLFHVGSLGSAISSPSRVWGRVPAEIDFGAF